MWTFLSLTVVYWVTTLCQNQLSDTAAKHTGGSAADKTGKVPVLTQGLKSNQTNLLSVSIVYTETSPSPQPSQTWTDYFFINLLINRSHIVTLVFFFVFLFFFFRAALTACGVPQARSGIRATTAGLYHSHSNTGSEPHLRTTPQFTATLDS